MFYDNINCGLNGYGLPENEYLTLIDLFYKFEEYYFYGDSSFYREYVTVLRLLDRINNNDLTLDIKYKNAILGWFIFFKHSKRRLAMHDFGVSITDNCQLYCKHCYDQNNKRNNITMSFDLFVELFYKHQEIAKKFVHYDKTEKISEIYLLGGEPTLNIELPRIINFLNKNNIQSNIETNGIYMPDNVIEALLQYKKNKVHVSIDGMYSSHDFIRGNGTFDKSVHTIKKLVNLGIEVNTNFIVNSYNYKDIVSYKKFFSDIGVSRCGLGRYINQNNKYISPIDEKITKEILNDITNRPEHTCNIGEQTIITANGGWRCCGKLSIPSIANYILDSEKDFLKKIKIFTIMFRSVPVYCFDCKKVSTCMGGMMCSKFKNGGKRNIEDITCNHLNCKEIYNNNNKLFV